jgi:hypothetical protein
MGWLTWFPGKLHLLGRFVFCGVVVPALLASPGDGRGGDERARRVRRVRALVGQVLQWGTRSNPSMPATNSSAVPETMAKIINHSDVRVPLAPLATAMWPVEP